MTKQIFKNISLILILITAIYTSSSVAYAAEPEVSGWIPYWRSYEGAVDALNNIDKLDAVHPFGYSVNANGTLNDLAKINKNASDSDAKRAWQNLFKEARREDVDIIPTITWTSGSEIDKILSDKKLRTKHIKEIVNVVKREKFDGINIDYEGKLADTRTDFSLFLKELKKALGKKTLACAIEARTPPESYYRVVPENIEYANDYKQIGKYCDQVQILAYDQGRADFKLNEMKAGTPYNPVSDTDWVRKVVELAAKDIPRNKIILGVATYGNEYEVTVAPNWFKDYRKLRSVTSAQALTSATTYGATPSRNKAGELSYSYLPPSLLPVTANSFAGMQSKLSVPAGTLSGELIAQKALAFANTTGQTTTFNLVWWSDAGAIKDKLNLVKEMNLRGIAIFKIDSEEDTGLWEI